MNEVVEGTLILSAAEM